jgi:hypothetical protein
MYGAQLLFFVSARTNKRHHHHPSTKVPDPTVLLPSPEVALALTSQEFNGICPMMTTALLPVAVSGLAPTPLKPVVKTVTLLEPDTGDFPAPAPLVKCRVK